MTKSHILTMALALTVGGVGAQARTLTPAEALQRASGAMRVAPSAPGHAPRLIRTVTMPALHSPALYLFESGREGAVVVAADDCVDASLLGYVDSYSPDSVPPALGWWLGQYAREIEAASVSAPVLPAAGVADRTDREEIGPLLTTRWNQDAPYNDLCPRQDGVATVTGCVATAMAQIMKYHTWPEHGKGYNSYYWGSTELSADFSSIYFDWQEMTDSYGPESTDGQRTAVATLMRACGFAVNMQYSPMASGTADFYVPSALVSYLNYDKGVRYAERDYFTLADWEEFIYGQLRDYGPLQYSGTSNDGGHSFVCDGYSADGFFHFNWGWGGMSDGFFRLSALDPGSQGIGGSSSGFNYQQAVVANIARLGKSRYVYDNVLMPDGFGILEQTARPGNYINVTGVAANFSIQALSGALTVKITNVETGKEVYATGKTFTDLPPLNYLNGWPVALPSNLGAGTYVITPALVNSRGIYSDIPVKLSSVGRVMMTVANGACTFSPVAPGSVRASALSLDTPLYDGRLFRLTATLVNSGSDEYVGHIVPALASGNRIVAQAPDRSADVPAGETMQLDYVGVFNRFASEDGIEPGRYTLYLMDTTSGGPVSDGIEVQYLASSAADAVTVSDFRIEGNADAADPARLRFTATITCTEGYFGAQPIVVIFPASDGNLLSLAAFTGQPVLLSEGESGSFSTGGAFAAAEPGKRYFAALFNGQQLLSERGAEVFFTIADTSAITAPAAAAAETVRYFDLQGRPVATQRPGQLLIRLGSHGATKRFK